MIRHGAVGVIPTDTVYGLVALASDSRAIEKMYSLKRRDTQPGTIVASSVDDLVSLGFDKKQLQKVAKYWPASLSVVLDATSIPKYLKDTRSSLAVRIPNHPTLLELLKKTGPLMTTSANMPGLQTSTSVLMAEDYFREGVDYYVDGGEINDITPSTIIGFDENDEMIVYREGAVRIEDLL